MTAALSVRGLSKTYGSVPALIDVQFELPAGEVCALLGLNGSGKSTTLHAVTGLIDRDRGTVEYGGVPLADPASRLSFGFAPDDLPLPGGLTGREYLALHDSLRGRDDSARAYDLAQAFDLLDALERQIDEYSHGMRRKIQLIASAMHAPRLLILDEPFRGLDPDAVIVLRQLVTTFRATDRAVLIATHDMALAERTCDRVVVLDRGAVAATGTPGELVATRGRGLDLEAAFLSITGREHESHDRRSLVIDSFDDAYDEA